MTELLRDIAAFGGQGWLIGAVVFLRVGAAMTLLPGFGERAIPMRIRLVVAGAFTLIVAAGVDIGALPDSLGLPLALGGARVVEPLLFHVRSSEPGVLLLVAAGILAVAVLAAAWPTWRAVRIPAAHACRADEAP